MNVIIDEGVETISEGGFGAAVTHLSLPASVTTIENDAFPQGLQTVTYGGTEAQRAAISIDDDNEGLENATWYYMPEITTQPTDTTVNEGATATLTAVATGGGLSHKWQYQKPGESTWTDVKTNGTSATYSLTTAARHNGYKYRCKVTNAAGSVYTSTVKLTVK